MNVIILAAGQGTRLRPYTNDRPKCMVSLKGKPLLHHQLATLKHCHIDPEHIALATGYLHEAIIAPNIRQFFNKCYASTNMVATLFSAKDFIQAGEDLIISYGDIIYTPDVFKKLLSTQGDIVIAADLNWYSLWSQRMPNPLDDAETFKMIDENRVIELGKKPQQRSDAQAQYIGLIKVTGHKIQDFLQHYAQLDKNAKYDGKDFKNMYMTSLIQSLIDANWNVRAALIYGGWLEVDSVEDLLLYEKQEPAAITVL